MKVSIIIATKNEAKNIDRLLKSLKNQTYQNYEVIVVDNNSIDKTLQIAKKFTPKVYNFGPERSAQRNYGAKRARGKYMLFLDADMELESNVIKECLEVIKSPNTAGIIIEEKSKGRGFLAKVKNLEKQLIAKELEAARFFKSHHFEKVGGYDQNLISGEDWDLSQRIQKLGKLKRIWSKIYHWEEESLIEDIRKKYYYAIHIQNYAKKHSAVFKKQASIASRLDILFQRPKIISKHPLEYCALLLLKSVQFAAYVFARIQKRYLQNLAFKLNQIQAIAGAIKLNSKVLYHNPLSLPHFISYVAGHFFYKLFRRDRTFTFNGQKYKYFYGLYNFTYIGERSVEIPIIWDQVTKHRQDKILEVGNVLSHYSSIGHDIVDKYEQAPGVINEDIITFNPNRKYDLIVSISTIEHVGWDEKRKSKHKIILAIAKIRNLLEKGGQAILTLPIGYNYYLDELIKSSRKKLFTNIFFLKRVSADNRWKQVPYKEATNTKFNTPYPFANALAIGIIKNDKLS